MRSTKLTRLWMVAMTALLMTSCGVLSKNPKTEQKPILNQYLKKGDPAPFNGQLVDNDTFKVLLKEASRKVNCDE